MPYYGSKRQHLDFILPLLPRTRVYVEPFGGSAAVLLNRPRSGTEVYSDIYAPVYHLVRAVRDDLSELSRQLVLTPYARRELADASSGLEGRGNMEMARLLMVRTYQGMLSLPTRRNPGWSRQLAPDARRGRPKAGSFGHVTTWRLGPVSRRLQGVEILNRDALDVIREYDSPDTLFYLDPPYVHEARGDNTTVYDTEMSAADHGELADLLRGIEGMAAVSGYASGLYDVLYPAKLGWTRYADRSKSLGAATKSGVLRAEVLWTNYPALAKCRQ